MNYDICKDIPPFRTIKKIKKILKDSGIKIEEFITERKVKFGLSNVSVHLKYKDIPLTNGKGTSKINAKASAYGELMERIQNQIIFNNMQNDESTYSPDAIIISQNALNKNIMNKYFDEENVLYNLEKVLNRKKTNTSLLIPFLNIKNNKLYNLPIRTLHHIQMSNGMAAGNTKEEALVQGLSEICERYAVRELWLNKISMPVIPPEIYEKYNNITALIKYYEKSGFNICIKDASMGKNLPVICVQIEDPINKLVHFSFGAHPFLPVAIERCLTEFIQCRHFKISEKEAFLEDNRFFSAEYFEYLIKNDIYSLINASSMRHVAFENNEYLKAQFLSGSENYRFTGDAWIKNKADMNNKKLLNFLINNMQPLTHNDIYIREVSYLDFPSFYIFIPKISELKFYTLQKTKDFAIFYKWYNDDIEDNSIYDNVQSLLTAIEFRIKNRFGYDVIYELGIPEEYLGLLCSIVLNNIEKINVFANMLISNKIPNNHFPPKSIALFKTIKDYFKLQKEYKEKNEIKKHMEKSYHIKNIDFCFKFIGNLSYEIIKKLLLNNKRISLRYSNLWKNKENFSLINEKLTIKYLNNIPNQYELCKLFSNE